MASSSLISPRIWTGLLAAVSLAAQSKKPEDLATGKILVTTREAPDPIFAQSVILLANFDRNGALGLMLNRRTEVPISRALRELQGAAAHSEPLFLGGPVELDTVFALLRSSSKPDDASEVLGKVYLVTARPALEKALAEHSASSELRVYVGYCGWGPGQLENEVKQGAWYVFNGSEDAPFDSEPATLWRRLVSKAESQVARRFRYDLLK